MKLTKEQFFKEWELSIHQQIKAGNTIITEMKFALPNFSKDQVWKLMNNGQSPFSLIIKLCKEFDLDIEESDIIYRLKKVQRSTKG